MSDTNGPVLVLGASGALGSRIASALIGQGHGVIGTSSTAESVARIPVAVQGRVVADLADAASCAALVAHVAGTYPSLSGIVIASGVVGFAPAESTPVDLASRMMAINYGGPAHIVSALFPQVQAGGGFVLGITGVVAEQVFPGMSAYTASKTALSAYLQTITKEWRRHKIGVTEARLGHTETGLATRPLFGAAPAMPTGLDPDHAVAVMLAAVAQRNVMVGAADF